jgi:hypothetical protein
LDCPLVCVGSETGSSVGSGVGSCVGSCVDSDVGTSVGGIKPEMDEGGFLLVDEAMVGIVGGTVVGLGEYAGHSTQEP